MSDEGEWDLVGQSVEAARSRGWVGFKLQTTDAVGKRWKATFARWDKSEPFWAGSVEGEGESALEAVMRAMEAIVERMRLKRGVATR